MHSDGRIGTCSRACFGWTGQRVREEREGRLDELSGDVVGFY
jgi:hypothetical protein